MQHSKARLTVEGRRLLVARVQAGPVSRAPKAQGVFRQCAHRWINRFRELGDAGLQDRSSRPSTFSNQTPVEVEQIVVEIRRVERVGQDRIAASTGIAARTVNRILHRHHLPLLRELDPITGTLIRVSKTTAIRYEHPYPSSLVHTDVKTLGRIPDGGGWKLHGRQMGSTGAAKRARIGFGCVRSLADDHSRYACSEILPDEKGATTAGFLARALDSFTAAGISVERLISDNHWSCLRSMEVADVLAAHGIRHLFIKPHYPGHNGKVERFNKDPPD